MPSCTAKQAVWQDWCLSCITLFPGGAVLYGHASCRRWCWWCCRGWASRTLSSTRTAFPLWALASLMWVVHTDSFLSLTLSAGFLDVSCAHRQLSLSDSERWLPWCELCTQTAFSLWLWALASLMWVVHTDSFLSLTLSAGFLDVSCAHRQLSLSDSERWLPWCELCTQTAFSLWLWALASLMWVVHTDSFLSLTLSAGFLDVSCAHRQLSLSDSERWLPWCELCTQTAFSLWLWALASLMWVVHTDSFLSLTLSAGFLDVSCAHRQLSLSDWALASLMWVVHTDSFLSLTLSAGFLDVSCAHRQLSLSDSERWLPWCELCTQTAFSLGMLVPWCELCTQTAFPLGMLASLMRVVHTDSFPARNAGSLMWVASLSYLLQLVPHFASLSYLSCSWYLTLHHCLISLAIGSSLCITVLSLLQLVPHFVSLSYLWSSYECHWWHCSQTTEAAGCLVLQCVEMVSPTQYNSCVDQDLCAVPLSISQMKRYTSQYSLSVSPVK